MPIRTIQEIKKEVDAMCGGPPAPPKFGEKVVAAIKWVDGTVIDCVREWRSRDRPPEVGEIEPELRRSCLRPRGARSVCFRTAMSRRHWLWKHGIHLMLLVWEGPDA